MVAVICLSGCVGKELTTIKGKEYTVEEIKDLANVEGYQYEVSDKLLELVVNEYEKDVILEDEMEIYLKRLKENGMELENKDRLKIESQMLYSKRLHAVYDKLITIDDSEVDKEFEKGYKQLLVEHAVIYPEYYQGDESKLDDVRKKLKQVKTEEGYGLLREEWEESESVDMQRMYITRTNIIPGFEDILDVKEEETMDFGQENYRSVMKVLSVTLMDKEEITQELRNAKILDEYSDSVKLLMDMQKVYEGLHFSDDLKEQLTK